MNKLMQRIIEVVDQVIVAGRDRLVCCSQLRVACEKWFQVEIVNALVRSSPIGGRNIGIKYEDKDIDITVLCEGQPTIHLELKTFPTNYGGGGVAVNQYVDSVVKDLKELSEVYTDKVMGAAVVLVYPIPDANLKRWTEGFFAQMQGAAKDVLFSRDYQLVRGGPACLYIFEANQQLELAGHNTKGSA